MYQRIVIALGAVALVSGCTFASKTYAPDGREAFSISCDGLANSWAGCFKKAGGICKERGYDTFTSSTDGGVLVTANPSTLTAGSVINRTLIIACKGAPTVQPATQ